MDQLFFIGIVPPEPIFSELEAFKVYAAKNFNSSHALRSPSHITVLSPFFLKTSKKEDAVAYLHQLAKEINDFEIKLKNFDNFGERVVFVNIPKNDHLFELHELLKKTFQQQDFISAVPVQKYKYHPHLTIAFKDLKSYYFAKAERYYFKLKYNRSFKAGKLHLFQFRNSRWFKTDEFQLNTEETNTP